MTKLKLSLTEQLKLVQNRANNHLIDFSIATNPKYKPNWHHEEIANELERIESGQFIKDGKKILMVLCHQDTARVRSALSTSQLGI